MLVGEERSKNFIKLVSIYIYICTFLKRDRGIVRGKEWNKTGTSGKRYDKNFQLIRPIKLRVSTQGKQVHSREEQVLSDTTRYSMTPCQNLFFFSMLDKSILFIFFFLKFCPFYNSRLDKIFDCFLFFFFSMNKNFQWLEIVLFFFDPWSISRTSFY